MSMFVVRKLYVRYTSFNTVIVPIGYLETSLWCPARAWGRKGGRVTARAKRRFMQLRELTLFPRYYSLL
jgi:hypothetical protein